MGVILGMFEMLAGKQFRPDRVTLAHARMSEIDVYLDHFGAPVVFGDERNSLIFPTAVLRQRIEGGDFQAHALARQFLGSQHRHLDLDQYVHELIEKLVPLGQGTLEQVAAALTMHPRTVQRQLRNLGASFETLLDDWRKEVALELLARPDVSMAEIAQQLGYAEQSTFTRSCRRWFAQTPRAKRQELRADVRRPQAW